MSLEAADPFIYTISDIGVSRYWVVTPVGTALLRGSKWAIRENVQVQRLTPSWAIVLAVLFFWVCFLGLLFLAVKEDRVTGTVEVSVATSHFTYVTSMRVTSIEQADQCRRIVYDVQRMSAY